nr:unnamed protein product [Spirometra erinaceieuropaei]
MPIQKSMKRPKSIQSEELLPIITRTVKDANCGNKDTSCGSSIVDPVWQNIDPNPDIRTLFTQFNEQFFENRLMSVEVKWSSRMTLCAGMCVYEGRGGLCSVRLSEPLLKFRPRSDLVETLLHEMIHAYLFITENNRDRDGHGPSFRAHMNRINKLAGTNITVYHSFHDEVDNYRVHWWQCNGPCAQKPPYFGLVRRAVNRAPGPNDTWWSEHQLICSGQFTKIKEPENYRKKAKTSAPDSKTPPSGGPSSHLQNGRDIRGFFGSTSSQCSSATEPSETVPKAKTTEKERGLDETAPKPHPRPSVVPFSGVGQVLGGTTINRNQSRLLALTNAPANVCTPPPLDNGAANHSDMVVCPVCERSYPMISLNDHLDRCLAIS